MKIVFSYDCEGNWGFVDWPQTPLAGLDPKALEKVYQTLCERHSTLDIPATFAFVALYTLPSAKRIAWIKERLPQLTTLLPNLSETGAFWEGETNIAEVAAAAARSDSIHIGSHGLTHRPIVDLSPAEQEMEFTASAELLSKTSGQTPQTFVYPRNLVAGRKACLAQFKTYRDTEALTVMQRAIDMNRAVTGIDTPRAKVTSDFIFWKGGHRRHFSDFGWKRLWQSRMKAARSGRDKDRVIHLWSHPHNFLTDPHLPARYEWLMELLNNNREYLEFLPMSDIAVSPKGTSV